MLTLKSEASQSAMPKILLATSLGAVFGFEVFALGEYAFHGLISISFSVWIILSHVLLGLAIGSVRALEWWQRGVGFGLLISVPVFVCGMAQGGFAAAYGTVALFVGPLVGLVIAYVCDFIFPITRESAGSPPAAPAAPVLSVVISGKVCGNALSDRLVEEETYLARLDSDRERLGDPGFGRSTEDRIVWGELLELEIQDIDEQMDRICHEADDEEKHWQPRRRLS